MAVLYFNITINRFGELFIYAKKILNGTNNHLFYSTLANKYYEIGDKEKAIYYAEKSAEINPEARDKVEKFIENANK